MNSIVRALTVAVFATALPLTLATPSRAAVGEVCFYTEPGYKGTSWCYRPWGYVDVPDFLHNGARSFESNSDVIVYAIDHAGGRRYYRKIWVGDRDPSWTWGNRIDGVATDDQGCELS
jgi:predicted amidohydrolase